MKVRAPCPALSQKGLPSKPRERVSHFGEEAKRLWAGGKSYATDEAFPQRQSEPVGHSRVPGWVLPEEAWLSLTPVWPWGCREGGCRCHLTWIGNATWQQRPAFKTQWGVPQGRQWATAKVGKKAQKHKNKSRNRLMSDPLAMWTFYATKAFVPFCWGGFFFLSPETQGGSRLLTRLAWNWVSWSSAFQEGTKPDLLKCFISSYCCKWTRSGGTAWRRLKITEVGVEELWRPCRNVPNLGCKRPDLV